MINVDSQKVGVIHLPWKIESVKQLANGQSASCTQINIRAVTPIKKNGKIIEIPSMDICMEGSKERSGSSSKKGIGTKMVLCTDIHLEGSRKITRSSSKIGVKTSEKLSLGTQLGDSQESSRSPSKKEVRTKKILNKEALTMNIKAQIPTWKTVKK